ncbi:MAG: hypothetical protein M1820_005056 [Bogoriella megaspora]|nr:MAG: hypothetical protein M1820_005056 [Bogoriella megaspora]
MAFAAIQKNLPDIERQLGKVNVIAWKGDSNTYKDAVKLARKSNSITSTIKKDIEEYANCGPSEDEARTFLIQMSKIVDMTKEQLGLLVKDKAHSNKLKVGALVKKSVVKTQLSSNDLSGVTVSKAPRSVKVGVERL